MKTRSSILAMAATLALGTSAFAQQQDGSRIGTPAQNPAQQSRNDVRDNTTPAPIATDRAAIPPVSADRQLEDIRQNPDTAPDRLFVLGVGADNLWEQRFSDVVQARSTDQNVRDLAKQISDDHRVANEKLRPVAERLRVTLPDQLSAEKQAKLSIFEALSPAQLDKVYLSHMKAGHAKAVTAYGDQQQLARSRELNQYVSDTLPKLRDHATHVNRVAQTKGITGDPAVAGASSPDNLTPKANEDARTGVPAPGAISGERRE